MSSEEIEQSTLITLVGGLKSLEAKIDGLKEGFSTASEEVRICRSEVASIAARVAVIEAIDYTGSTDKILDKLDGMNSRLIAMEGKQATYHQVIAYLFSGIVTFGAGVGSAYLFWRFGWST